MTVSNPNNPSERPGDRPTAHSRDSAHPPIGDEVVFHPRRATRKMRQDPEFVALRAEYEAIQRGEAEQSESTALRWLVAAYEAAVSERLRRGERLRAVLTSGGDASASSDDDVLRAYLARVTDNATRPVPLLGRMYESAVREEERLAAIVELAMIDHPVWPWLSGISGIGTILAARLLSRLDITRARTPSALWKYCGLATVPGALYECSACGTFVSGAPGLRHTPFHRTATGLRCVGSPSSGRERSVNVAEPRPRAGESRSYDATARMACHLIGVSFARRGLGYKALYKGRVAALAERHPEWPPKRIYLAAQRATVKRFLADLWGEWRKVAGLPVVAVYGLHTRRQNGEGAVDAMTG